MQQSFHQHLPLLGICLGRFVCVFAVPGGTPGGLGCSGTGPERIWETTRSGSFYMAMYHIDILLYLNANYTLKIMMP